MKIHIWRLFYTLDGERIMKDFYDTSSLEIFIVNNTKMYAEIFKVNKIFPILTKEG